MHRQSLISRWCERIVEAGWLLALSLIPIYFNLYSARHFEPDKASVLRSIVLVMAAAGLVRGLEALASRGEPATPPPDAPPPGGPPLWRRFVAIPLALPTLLYGLVFLVSTLTSVVPWTSFWGSYQRMQGTVTNLSYILLFVMIAVSLRSRAQLERIVTVTLAAATAAGGYGILQHQGLDPLPWRGDVITRVASTMGNSIFIAAYLIMVIPLALYRLVAHLGERRAAPPAAEPGREWLWALARGLLLLAGLLLFLAVIMIGAAVRTVDFRYWWLFPAAVASATALWWLLSLPLERREPRIPAWPALLFVGVLLLFGLQFAFSAGAGVQAVAGPDEAPRAALWWLFLLLSVLAAGGGYGLALSLPALPAAPSRERHTIGALAAGAVALLLGLAVFFTQSRGPWIGLGAGMFVFFTLLLTQAVARARATGRPALASRLRSLLIGWVGLALAAGAFLVAFNLSDAPFFRQLREVPYIGRMGQLLEVDRGTGLVRRLIWAGDEHAGGAVGLISSDPLRALVGWGPESMFVAFNPFYPPSLANVEARGASPDRSHQAILDELVTRGFLGLASYLFLLGSFVALAWRLLRRSDEWRWQVFFIAALSAVAGNVVEGLTGIPIVSTLMMFWVLLALTLTGGALAGHYRLSLLPEPAPAAEPAPPAAEPAGARQPGQQQRRRQQPRGQQPRAQAAPRRGRQATPAAALAAYATIGVLALGLAWWFNIQPVYADMRFQQGQGAGERATSIDGLLISIDDYLATIRSNPREDFYYLNLGRSLMTLADNLRLQGVEPGEPVADPDVDELLRLEGPDQIVGFAQRTPPNALMSYAEAVLLRAHDLNPLNKDHYANLGRLNSFWYGWAQDTSRLLAAADWYGRVTAIAPQDVTLINERAGVLIQLGDAAAAGGDAGGAQERYDEARQLLDRSAELDPRFADTFLRIGDLQRTVDGDLDAATASYLRAVELAAPTTAGSVEDIAGDMAERPDLLRQLRDGYTAAVERAEATLATAEGQPERAADLPILRERAALLHSVVGLLTVRVGEPAAAVEPYRRAAELLPSNASYSRNYTIVLSDTGQYDAAIDEINRVAAALRAAGQSAQADQAAGLIPIIEQARQ